MKTKFGKKLLSVLMAFAMLVSLVQGTGIAASVAKAADDQKYVTLHFYNTYNWSTPALQYWNGDAEVTNYGETGEITGWGVNGYTLTAEGDNWYKITLKGGFNGFQFLDFSAPGNNTGGVYAEAMKYCTKSEATDLYCKWGKETNYAAEWYLDKNYTTSIETLVPADALKESTMTFHYKNTENWAKVAVKVAEGGSWTSIAGFEQYNTWPGVELEKDENGYYTVTVTKDASTCNVIFTDGVNGSGNQTGNICKDPQKAVEEYWVSGSGNNTVVTDTKPTDESEKEDDSKEEEKTEATRQDVVGTVNATESNVTVHFDNSTDYENVYVHMWEEGGASLTQWPGQNLSKDEDGYYTVNIPTAKIGQLNFIFNNNNDKQTDTTSLQIQKSTEEYWITNGVVTDSAPVADNDKKYVQLHFFVPTEYGWKQPAMQYWGGTQTEVSTKCLGEITNWGGAIGYELTLDTTTTKGSWYKITLRGDFEGFQFLDFENPTNTTGGVYPAETQYCNKETATNLYLFRGEMNKYAADWYLDRTLETEIKTLIPEGTATETEITVHFKNTDNWDEVAAYFKEGGSWADIKGYETGDWPGKVVTADESGWYTVTVKKDMTDLHFIFNNNNNGKQTDNLLVTPKAEKEEYWVVDGTVYSYMPTQYTMHYYAPDWSECYAFLTQTSSWSAIPGYTAASSWPGASIKKDTKNTGWYTVTVKKDNSQFNCIFNNNNGVQTSDICLTSDKDVNEYWVTGTKNDNDTKYTTDAPEGWVASALNDIYVDDNAAEPTRFALVEYNRPAGDYEDWNIYCWNSGWGKATEQVYPTEINGKQYIIFPIMESTADVTIGFCMRRSTSDDPWAEKDGNDHALTIPAGQSVVHAVFDQGKGITKVYPSNRGVELLGKDKKISFYYRDDALVLTDSENSLEGKVKVVVNGQELAMEYDAENERYSAEITDIKSGRYTYYYVVDGKELTDSFNANETEVDGKKCSYVDYEEFENVTVEASFANTTMDYNDNNVLSVKVDGVPAEKLAKIVADASGLGLGNVEITTDLMAGTLSVVRGTATGKKNLPVVVTDIYGNEYTATATVEVVSRDNDGFDWDEAVIYFAVTDRFFDGNEANNTGVKENDVDKAGSLSYHGGDFAGLQEKLDYLKGLGVNTIWITPIVSQSDITTKKDGEVIESTGYHGYWASDFTKLNGHLGTEEEFAALIDAVHANGMKLMVDVVLNHSGYDSDTDAVVERMNTTLFDENGNAISMIRDESNTIKGDTVYDSLANLPDFATEIPAVRDQLVAWQTDWVEKYGIDYYRVDTVKHVNTETWYALKNELTKIDPDFKMIGEYSGGGYTTLSAYEGAMDSLLDFDFNDQAQAFVKGGVEAVEAFLENRNASINNTRTLGSFLSSHDENGLLYKLINADGIDEETATNLFKVAAALQMTAKGQVVIYYGEEIGQTGADNYPYQTNRRDFDWDEMEKQAGETDSMFNHYKKLLAIRNANTDVLAKGTRTAVAVSNEKGYDVFTRTYGNEKLYVALNVKDAQKVTFAVDAVAGSVLTDLYSGATYTVAADKTVTINLASPAQGGTAILKVTSVPAISVAPASTAAGQVIKAAVANVKNTVSNIVRRITGRRNRTQAAAQTEEVVADEETTVEETEEAADAEEITVESNDSEEIVTIEEAATPTAAEKSLPVAPIAAGVVVLIVVATSLTVVMKKKKY